MFCCCGLTMWTLACVVKKTGHCLVNTMIDDEDVPCRCPQMYVAVIFSWKPIGSWVVCSEEIKNALRNSCWTLQGIISLPYHHISCMTLFFAIKSEHIVQFDKTMLGQKNQAIPMYQLELEYDRINARSNFVFDSKRELSNETHWDVIRGLHSHNRSHC